MTEAKELARHTDIKMTMKYTHIGIDDQSKAVQGLKCEWIGSDSGVSERPEASQPVAPCPEDPEVQKRQNPCGDRGSDAHCPNVSPDVSGDCQWRRRESNACLASDKYANANDLQQDPRDVSVFCQCQRDGDCPGASPHDAMLASVIAAWPSLSDETKRIVTVLAGISPT